MDPKVGTMCVRRRYVSGLRLRFEVDGRRNPSICPILVAGLAEVRVNPFATQLRRLPGREPLVSIILSCEGLGAPSTGRVGVRRDPGLRLPPLLWVRLTSSHVGHLVSVASLSLVAPVVSTARSSRRATPGPSAAWRPGWGACLCGTTGRRSDASGQGRGDLGDPVEPCHRASPVTVISDYV
jgi:hypothetical protein